MTDNNNVPKKLAKKTKPKRASFDIGAKAQTLLSSQENKEASFTSLLLPSLNVATLSRIVLKESGPSRFCLYLDEVKSSKLEPASSISPRHRQKTVLSNQKSPISKNWEMFGNQELTDYLSSTTNMVEYKNSC